MGPHRRGARRTADSGGQMTIHLVGPNADGAKGEEGTQKEHIRKGREEHPHP